jgi:hypothetical protein
MAAIRTRISTLLVILVVAVLAATVGFQLAQGTTQDTRLNRSATIDLLDRKKASPPGRACYKQPPKHNKPDSKNPNCPTGPDHGGGGDS